MVQFNKLRLTGFKSFVESTELSIQAGMTGIVGPNGCGKSNLVEALRWVMGETSAKRMRGGEMDDVIFGGSGNDTLAGGAGADRIDAGGDWGSLSLAGFGPALGIFATPMLRAATGLRAGLASWVAARRQAAEDDKLWALAQTDARLMADISRAMSSDAAREVRYY